MPGRTSATRAAVTGLLTLVLVAGVLVLALWWFQRALIYFPDPGPPPPADRVVPGAQDVTLTTEDGLDLGAWYLPARPPCGGAVLVSPGNGGNRAGRAGLMEQLGERGLGVLLLDYRGYGGNPGTPSEAGLARDARAALSFLRAEGFRDEDLVYLGESLGAAVAARLATEHPPGALVLRSPFTSLADAGERAYGIPVGPLLRDRFDVLEHARQTDVPVAVVYGRSDTIVPPDQSREVAGAAREAGNPVVEVEVPGAGHNDAVLAEGDALVDALTRVVGLADIEGCG